MRQNSKRRLPVLLCLVFVVTCLRLLSYPFAIGNSATKDTVDAEIASILLNCKTQMQSKNYTKDTICPRMDNDHSCHCPPQSWAIKSAEKMPTQSDLCRMISGSSMFLAGDSIIRDTWIAGAMWLLVLDGFNVLRKNLTDTAACFSCAWGFLEPAGILDELRAAGFLEEEEHIKTFSVCNRTTHLIFKYAARFDQYPEVFELAALHNATALITSHGILEMSHSQDDDAVNWTKALDLQAIEHRPTVYVSTHHRIIELMPREWRHERERQGNAALRRRHAVVSANRSPGGLRVVDAYRLTQGLGVCYRDTGDGLHFGLWVNLQRFWLAVFCVHDPRRCDTMAAGSAG
jgi:hypothetical protein